MFAEGIKRNNAAYLGPALIEMEIAGTDKCAEWSFRACCEIWMIQGHAKSRLFFRAIFDSCLEPIFTARENAFLTGLELLQTRTGIIIPQGMPVIIASLKQQMAGLRAKWNTKLEIASRDNDYMQQRSQREKLPKKATSVLPGPAHAAAYIQQGPNQADARVDLQTSGESLSPVHIRTAALSFSWKELESRFRQLQARPAVHERVTADFTRTEWESGSVTEEWTMHGSSICKAEFERFAIVAARKLGYLRTDDAIRCWLDKVRGWLLRTGLDQGDDMTWRPTGEGHVQGRYFKDAHLSTNRIAEISALVCIDLLSEGNPESVILPPVEKQAIASRQSQPRLAGAQPKKTLAQMRKTEVIFGAIQLGLTARKYCAVLDERKARLPVEWIEDGCPPTYAQAYGNERWRKRIQDEKCRYRKQYDITSISEREAIIQGQHSTRPTRR